MNKGLTAFMIIVSLLLVSFIVSNILNIDNSKDIIQVIQIHGVISVDKDSSFTKSVISSSDIVKQIEEAGKNDNVKGIIVDINSPGGTVVGSQEIAEAIKNLNKTKYAVIRDVGASGGYWAASAANKIYASPVSITGSIGVISSYLEFNKLFEKYGINYERLVSGERKDIGSPYRELTKEEKQLLQKKIDMVYDYFVRSVAENRGLKYDYVSTLATGEFYTGEEAKKLGLIDEFGNKQKAIEDMKKNLKLKEVQLKEAKEETSLLELLSSLGAYNFGKGFASTLIENNLGNKLEIKV